MRRIDKASQRALWTLYWRADHQSSVAKEDAATLRAAGDVVSAAAAEGRAKALNEVCAELWAALPPATLSDAELDALLTELFPDDAEPAHDELPF